MFDRELFANRNLVTAHGLHAGRRRGDDGDDGAAAADAAEAVRLSGARHRPAADAARRRRRVHDVGRRRSWIQRGFDPRMLVGVGFAIAAWSLWRDDRLDADDGLARRSSSRASCRGSAWAWCSCRSTRWRSPRWRRNYRTEGSSLMNLARNIGASVGISVVTALLARNIQTNHQEIGGSITSYNQAAVDPVDQLDLRRGGPERARHARPGGQPAGGDDRLSRRFQADDDHEPGRDPAAVADAPPQDSGRARRSRSFIRSDRRRLAPRMAVVGGADGADPYHRRSTRPPVRVSAPRSSFSHFGRQLRGKRRSLTTMSAAAQAAANSAHIDHVHAAGRQHGPAPRPAEAEVAIAARLGLFGQQQRIGGVPAILAQQIARIVARAIAQDAQARRRSSAPPDAARRWSPASPAAASPASRACRRSAAPTPAAATASATAPATIRRSPSVRKPPPASPAAPRPHPVHQRLSGRSTATGRAHDPSPTRTARPARPYRTAAPAPRTASPRKSSAGSRRYWPVHRTHRPCGNGTARSGSARFRPPVRSAGAKQIPSQRRSTMPASLGPNQRRIAGCSCSATIAVTAAKDS